MKRASWEWHHPLKCQQIWTRKQKGKTPQRFVISFNTRHVKPLVTNDSVPKPNTHTRTHTHSLKTATATAWPQDGLDSKSFPSLRHWHVFTRIRHNHHVPRAGEQLAVDRSDKAQRRNTEKRERTCPRERESRFKASFQIRRSSLSPRLLSSPQTHF